MRARGLALCLKQVSNMVIQSCKSPQVHNVYFGAARANQYYTAIAMPLKDTYLSCWLYAPHGNGFLCQV